MALVLLSVGADVNSGKVDIALRRVAGNERSEMVR